MNVQANSQINLALVIQEITKIGNMLSRGRFSHLLPKDSFIQETQRSTRILQTITNVIITKILNTTLFSTKRPTKTSRSLTEDGSTTVIRLVDRLTILERKRRLSKVVVLKRSNQINQVRQEIIQEGIKSPIHVKSFSTEASTDEVMAESQPRETVQKTHKKEKMVVTETNSQVNQMRNNLRNLSKTVKEEIMVECQAKKMHLEVTKEANRTTIKAIRKSRVGQTKISKLSDCKAGEMTTEETLEIDANTRERIATLKTAVQAVQAQEAKTEVHDLHDPHKTGQRHHTMSIRIQLVPFRPISTHACQTLSNSGLSRLNLRTITILKILAIHIDHQTVVRALTANAKVEILNENYGRTSKDPKMTEVTDGTFPKEIQLLE